MHELHTVDLLSMVDVGTWDWDLTTGTVIYSATLAGILGYTVQELTPSISTWEKMILPEDFGLVHDLTQHCLSGNRSLFEAEYRMIRKDGSIIWVQDKGCVLAHEGDGQAMRFVGVLQDISRLKSAEQRLLANQEVLDLAVHVAGLGTWDLNLPLKRISYNDEYLRTLGFSQDDMTGDAEEWKALVHPQDLSRVMKRLTAYVEGNSPIYDCEFRMQRRDGQYIWVRDICRVTERDANGKPVRLVGGHLNIDEIKCSEQRLTEALESLADSNTHLESEMERRNKELLEQDKMLWTVNQISRRLLTSQPQDDFSSLIESCLRLLGESINKSRVYIWKDRTAEDGVTYCTQIYEWVRDVRPIQDDKQYAEIPYQDLPSFADAIDHDRCLNSLIRDLSKSEQQILGSQGIKTILIAPIAINGNRWGFIGIDNCEDEALFSSIEENMLMMSGSMIATTIEKMDTEARLREMEARTQIMLNATPLCCNLWTTDFENMSCNDEAVRLFDLSSQQEYLDRFNELSPEYQPCGTRSDILAAQYISKAFQEGYCRFEWLHKKLDGTPIPAEITLVRIKYRDSFIVAGYTRDLREFKAMLAELQSKEDDLRTARDEALLNSKAKSNFLANMSHEIRTPMNAISGLTEIMLRESPDEKTAEYARGIKNACSNLLNIINDILDISKIESGKLEIYNAPYELASLLHDVISIARMRLGKKPLMFLTDIDSRLPAQLIGDEIRIKQILINMLSNAIKFTQKGYISLQVSGMVKGNRTLLCFSVKDTGVGIKPEDLQRLFAEFERVNTTKNRSIEGTGLGLAISKQLCEMMNGSIEVHSTYGEGSEFIALIPQECPSYERLAQVQEPKKVLLYEPRDRYRSSITNSLKNLDCMCVTCSNQSELFDNIGSDTYDYILTASLHLKKVQSISKKNRLSSPIAAFADYDEANQDRSVYTILFPVSCLQLAALLNGTLSDGDFTSGSSKHSNFAAPSAHVLVVDDNPVNLQVAAGLMEPYQFKIDTAENGIEAVEKVKKNTYDLVFMDHMMPEMDGIDATVAIRQLDGKYFQNLPIVALTANALVGTREMFIREGMNDFLAKPIEINKLAQILAKWLPKQKIVKLAPKEQTKHALEAPELHIAGVNVEQGILSVGGNQNNYLHILSSYYADGRQKCASLLHHIMEKDISAFRTEIHAIKSTSATIGALDVSAMAAKLEAAAQSNDVAFIDGNIDSFLASYQDLLEAIRPFLTFNPLQVEPEKNAKTQGDVTALQGTLDALHDAAEFANIDQIEALLSDLEGFTWPDAVTRQIEAMRECMNMFDYDGVLECIARAKELA